MSTEKFPLCLRTLGVRGNFDGPALGIRVSQNRTKREPLSKYPLRGKSKFRHFQALLYLWVTKKTFQEVSFFTLTKKLRGRGHNDSCKGAFICRQIYF